MAEKPVSTSALNVYVPLWLRDEVTALASERERSVSYVVRQAIAEFMAREKPLTQPKARAQGLRKGAKP